MTTPANDLAGLRVRYDLATLDDDAVPGDPLAWFDAWLAEAIAAVGPEATAAALATVGAAGPAVRIVLLKGRDVGGFVFFGNHASRKGRELALRPQAALCFFWPSLQRQVRVEGPTAAVADAEADSYFASRPRESQLGAWASPQSEVVASRAALDAAFEAAQARFASGPVPRPPSWGGWRMEPAAIEFWQGRPGRLHDRIVFTSRDGGWARDRLAP